MCSTKILHTAALFPGLLCCGGWSYPPQKCVSISCQTFLVRFEMIWVFLHIFTCSAGSILDRIRTNQIKRWPKSRSSACQYKFLEFKPYAWHDSRICLKQVWYFLIFSAMVMQKNHADINILYFGISHFVGAKNGTNRLKLNMDKGRRLFSHHWPTKTKKTKLSFDLFFSREDKIRTCDPLHPIQVRYRAAPLPEHGLNWAANIGM